jgi:hypothetical protein
MTPPRRPRLHCEARMSRRQKPFHPNSGASKQFVSFHVASWLRADYRRLRHIGMGMPAVAVVPHPAAGAVLSFHSIVQPGPQSCLDGLSSRNLEAREQWTLTGRFLFGRRPFSHLQRKFPVLCWRPTTAMRLNSRALLPFLRLGGRVLRGFPCKIPYYQAIELAAAFSEQRSGALRRRA